MVSILDKISPLHRHITLFAGLTLATTFMGLDDLLGNLLSRRSIPLPGPLPEPITLEEIAPSVQYPVVRFGGRDMTAQQYLAILPQGPADIRSFFGREELVLSEYEVPQPRSEIPMPEPDTTSQPESRPQFCTMLPTGEIARYGNSKIR